jgi:hypothetical protein
VDAIDQKIKYHIVMVKDHNAMANNQDAKTTWLEKSSDQLFMNN